MKCRTGKATPDLPDKYLGLKGKSMENIKDNVLELVGHTPLVRLSRLFRDEWGTEIVAKVESCNPGGSVKDRTALAMIEAAERSGQLQPNGVLIEPTSGNTGIGMAWIAVLKGYRVILTMPETMSLERRRLLAFLGCELVLTPGKAGMQGAVERAGELHRQLPGSVILQQFDNPANPAVHEATTAAEILADTDGRVDVLVACVGTGGTLCGTGRGLKAVRPEVEVVAVEPSGSPVLSGGTAGSHRIQGIGAGFVPGNYNADVVDRVMQVTDEEAMATMRMLARKEGLLAGISSGAAVAAALTLARSDSYRGKRLVVMLPDTGERYLSLLSDGDA